MIVTSTPGPPKTADLEGADGGTLEAEIGLEVLSNLTDETLERQLADQELRRLLVATDLTESHGTGAVTMGLLDASCEKRNAGSVVVKR
jgi:hypothetical protein